MSKNVLTASKDKRIAIFASYSKQKIVPNYVLQYLEYLKEVASVIIFLADNQAPIEEQAKLKNLVTYAHFEPHGEYDFGSYKRGFCYAKQHHLLDDAEEVILVNDSCYAISGFKAVFTQMSKKPCDFWGMTESLQIAHHLQSFFLVFKKPLFLALEHYLAAVTLQNTVSEVILQYEVPLKGQLELLGFKGASFTDIFRESNPTCYQNSLITRGVPLIKKKIFTPILNSFYKESTLKTLKLIKRINPQTMVNILQDIGVKSVKALILKKLLLTIFRREVTHHYMDGPMVRYKVKLFNVGLFTYKKSDSSQLKHYCFDLIMR